MPQPNKRAPDFIPAEQGTPDFIPAETTAPDTPTERPGFLQSALNATGLPSLYHAFTDEPTAEENASGVEAYNKVGGRGIMRLGKGLVGSARDSGEKLKMAAHDAGNGQFGAAAADALEATPLLGGFLQNQEQNYEPGDTSGNVKRMGGTLAGTIGSLWAPVAASKGLRAVGPAMMRAGAGAVNHAIEATPKMMARGANPGAGMIEEGVTPNFSKFGMQQKLDTAIPAAGQRVSAAVYGAPGTVPLQDIAHSIRGPINEARGIIEGPGGGGRSFAPVHSLGESMARRAPGASRPIFGPGAGTPFSADEAHAAMTQPLQHALPAPMEDVPLHASPDVPGTPSRPVTIYSSGRSGPRGLPAPTGSAPMAPGHADIFPEQFSSATSSVPLRKFGEPVSGLGQGESIGQIAGERGGPGQVQGVFQRRATYPASDSPSPFADLRHPTATAPDVWQTVRNLDRNTRFNPDPEVEGVNEVRRAMRGGLRNNLEQAVPDLKPLSQRYSDLVTADEALSRTAGRGSPLKSIKDAFAFPAETAGGHVLYKAGKAASHARVNPFYYTPQVFANRSQ